MFLNLFDKCIGGKTDDRNVYHCEIYCTYSGMQYELTISEHQFQYYFSYFSDEKAKILIDDFKKMFGAIDLQSPYNGFVLSLLHTQHEILK